MKIWKQIILGFILVIIIMIIVDAVALMNNVQIIRGVNDLEHSKRIELAQAYKVAYFSQQVKSSVTELSLSLQIEGNNNSDKLKFVRNEVESNIKNLLSEIEILRGATHVGYCLARNEKDIDREREELMLIDSLSSLTATFVSDANTTLRLLEIGDIKKNLELSLTPLSKKILDLVSVVLRDAEEEVNRAVSQLNIRVDKAVRLGISLTILSILLSLSIGLSISRSISRPLYQLISGTKEIGKGNFKTTVFSGTTMELKELASAFNSMVEELEIRISAINKLNAELEESNQTKDRYFSIIAHDLKNPFSVILGFTDLLVEGYHDFSEEERQTIIQDLNNTSKKVYDLLENLLTWSRSQSRKIELNPETIDLNSIIEDCINSYERNAEQKQITLKNNISGEINVYADLFTLTVVINNILSNAIKFTPDGGFVAIKAVSDKNYVEIIIEDTGIGMNQEIIDNFLQSEKVYSTPGTRNEKGTGLGLMLVRDFIRKNNGTLFINSVPGSGTEFSFTLPVFG